LRFMFELKSEKNSNDFLSYTPVRPCNISPTKSVKVFASEPPGCVVKSTRETQKERIKVDLNIFGDTC
jgi:hypothetical protein